MTVAAVVLAASPAIRAIRAEGVEFRVYDDEGAVALSISAPRADCLGTGYFVPGEIAVSANVSGWKFEGRSREGRFDEEGTGRLAGELAFRCRSQDRRGAARLPGAVYDGRVRGEGATIARLSSPAWSEEAILAARSYSLSPEGDRAAFRGDVVILLPPEAAEELGFARAAATVECDEADFSFRNGLERAVFSGAVRLCTEEALVACRRLELREAAGEFDAGATGGVQLDTEGLSVAAARAEISAGLLAMWEGRASWKTWSFSFAELVYDTASGAFTARDGRFTQ